ncbi:MAG: P-II family nitrogen regulator [Eubacteriales bacterium]|nr:P-II family nitrogen regulator [Eubacteriales bacterium]MDD3073503.1 P-II family nitrogen regulator [Eubacteriales bacterium]MDD4079194.1 P-II family nitrogen regulator [Eubacteriales bacterium]MDD4769101.1 P-II family nitrogen regulator [Eubacteriales bacterium]
MDPNKNHKLIVAIVKKGYATKIVAAAKKAGAHGGTIIFGRGSAEKNLYESIFGIAYQPEKEIIFIAVGADKLDNVLQAITKEGNLDKPGRGIGFVLDLAKIIGVVHLSSITCDAEVSSLPETKNKFDLIVTIVNKGIAPDVIKASKNAGAEGGTILTGRGSGIHETAKIFGFPIEPEKDIILTLIEEGKTQQVLQAIEAETGLEEPGRGIAFILSVEKTVGICHLMGCAE